MHTFVINIARAMPGTTQFGTDLPRYEHWGKVQLSETDGTNESEARTKFNRIVAAFPAPGWCCELTAWSRPVGTQLDKS